MELRALGRPKLSGIKHSVNHRAKDVWVISGGLALGQPRGSPEFLPPALGPPARGCCFLGQRAEELVVTSLTDLASPTEPC